MNTILGYQLAERIIEHASSASFSIHSLRIEETKIQQEEMSEFTKKIYREHTREYINKLGALYSNTKWMCKTYNTVSQPSIDTDDYFNNLHAIIQHKPYVQITKIIREDLTKNLEKGLRHVVQDDVLGIPSRHLDMMIVAAEDYYRAVENLHNIPQWGGRLSDAWNEVAVSDVERDAERLEYMSTKHKIKELLEIKSNKYNLFKSAGDQVIKTLMEKSNLIGLSPRDISDILVMNTDFKMTGLGDYNKDDFDLGYNAENCRIIKMLH
jgi:hypothetical protein